MGALSDLDLQLNEVRNAIEGPAIDAERKLDSVLRDLDELCALALKSPELLNRRDVGCLVTRSQLLMSFLLAQDQPRLRVVR